MPLTLDVTELLTPKLELGDAAAAFSDPRIGLTEVGPLSMRFGQKSQVRLGLVGPGHMVGLARGWFDRCQKYIPTGRPGSAMYVDFPGFEKAFHSELAVHASWFLNVEQDLAIALMRSGRDRFESVLRVYAAAVEKLTNQHRLDIVACCLPPEVISTCWTISRSLTPVERARIARQKRRADSAQLSFEDQWQSEDTDEDLLRRDFRRALKSKTMALRMPIQIVTSALLLDEEGNQDPATRAWNSTVAMFYKAGGLPWRVRFDGPETCFIGISFHWLKTSQGDCGYSSLAQAFSTDGDGFALRGDALLKPSKGNDKKLHLTQQQASELAVRVLAEYADRTGRNPSRVVLHKTTQFDEEEREGFGTAFSSIPVVEFVNLAPSDFRLVQRSAYPPKRGTLCRINNGATYLFATGFVPEWKTYPGVHIPVPVRIRTDRGTDIVRTAIEVLGLARMNWNTAFDTTGAPITLRFARQVGGIMAEVRPPRVPHPSYRFYM